MNLFFWKKPTQLNFVRVYKDNILHNFNAFKDLSKKPIIPILKSNAYGHGLIEVYKILKREKNIPYIGLQSLTAALNLLPHSSHQLLIVGYVPAEDIVAFSSPRLTFGITSLEQLIALHALAKKPVAIHLKFDTGMHRQGIMPEELQAAIKIVQINANLHITGAYSHLSDADADNTTATDQQIKSWNTIYEQLEKAFGKIDFHLANTAGHSHLQNIQSTMTRLGIGLYGYPQGEKQRDLDLQPALELVGTVSSVREIPAGDSVGYNNTFTAQKPTKLATVTAGYFEGLDRRLSNQGSFIIHNTQCPIVGRISMNITSCALDNLACKMGDEVTLISKNPTDLNSVENIAKLIGTIPYEITTRIPAHLPRIII